MSWTNTDVICADCHKFYRIEGLVVPTKEAELTYYCEKCAGKHFDEKTKKFCYYMEHSLDEFG